MDEVAWWGGGTGLRWAGMKEGKLEVATEEIDE